MKTAKIVFSLLLLNVLFALPREVKAQTFVDTLYVSGAGPDTWQFSVKHDKQSNLNLSNIVLWIDTTLYPNVRFVTNGIQAYYPLVANQWLTNIGSSDGGDYDDSAYWCADVGTDYIAPGQKDSFFDFTLEPLANGTNLFYYPIQINWYTNWATGSDCSNVQKISSGSFNVYDVPWLGNTLDQVTATSSNSGCNPCDPVFNFTVTNKNSYLDAIDGMAFQCDQFVGTIRPCDIQLPSGWVLDTVTQYEVVCHSTSGGINSGQSLSGFIIGLSASSSATAFSFPWEALSGGTIIDADTVLNVPATAQTCSADSSSDITIISNTTKCSFSANLENFHSGPRTDTVSPITGFILTTPTPGVTIAEVGGTSGVLPPFGLYPWARGWNDSGANTNKLTFYIQNKPILYGQPGGISAPWGFTLNNANDAQIIIINWETLDYGKVISSGTDTIHCTSQPTRDTAWLVGSPNGCEYALAVKNIHIQPSNIGAVSIQMAANGTIPNVPGTYSGPAGWTGSVGNGSALFQTTTNQLKPGLIDTFFFTTSPTTTGKSWPLNYITYLTFPTIIADDTIQNVAGCTPAVVCDTVTMSVNDTSCLATLTVNNRRTTATIDSVVVIPMGGWQIGSVARANIPWSMLPIDTKRDSVIFVGNLGTELTQTFFVSFNFGPNTKPFPVMINTYSNGVVCTTIDTMTCASAAVTLVAPPGEDLALTVVPNPLSSRSDISFKLGSFSGVNVMLVDILGRTQATLFSGTLASGDHTLPLDASTLAPGTYYIRLETEGQRVTKKIVVEH